MSEENKAPKEINLKFLMFLLVVFLGLFMFLPGVVLIIAVGMLPTFGAMISDPSRIRAQTYCVGICNFAGLFPALHQLFLERFSLPAAYSIIHNEYNLLIILGSAAVGWMIFFVVPGITVSFYRNRDKMTLVKMVRRYKDLKEVWGDSLPSSDVLSNPKSAGNEDQS